MSAQTAAAPAAKNSAPNKTAGPKGAAPEYNGNLQVADIVPDGQNRHDDAGLPELAASIKGEGLLQPIVVRPCPKFAGAIAVRHVVDKTEHFRVFQGVPTTMANLLYEADDKRDADRAAAIYRSGAGWQIIAGERRWRAHRLNKAETIRGFIHRGETDVSAAVKQTIENLGRKDLNPIEEARQMKRLEDLKVPQKEIGALFGGRSQPVVSNTLKVLALPVSVLDMIAKGELTISHGAELMKWLPWPRALEKIATLALKNGWEAKRLRADELPFDDQLQAAKLGKKIDVSSYSYDGHSLYKVTDAMQGKPGFYKSGFQEWFYLYPEDPKAPNLWAPEKARQDAARKSAAAAATKAVAKPAGKNGKPSKEQLEQKKKLDDNKARRAENDGTLANAINELRDAKGIHPAALAVICDHVLGSHDMVPAMEAAAVLGIKKLPRQLELDDAGAGGSNEGLRGLGAEIAVKLAATVIMLSEAGEARKYAGEVPSSTSFIAGKAAKISSVQVKVRRKGSDHFAKAGEAKATSTSGFEAAAKAAAAKHFTCAETQVKLLRMDVVDEDEDEDATGTASFTATRGGGLPPPSEENEAEKGREI